MIAIVLLIIPVAHLLAQAPPPPGGGGDAGAPIDGGISLLVAAGVAYGAKKANARKKAKELKETAEK